MIFRYDFLGIEIVLVSRFARPFAQESQESLCDSRCSYLLILHIPENIFIDYCGRTK